MARNSPSCKCYHVDHDASSPNGIGQRGFNRMSRELCQPSRQGLYHARCSPCRCECYFMLILLFCVEIQYSNIKICIYFYYYFSKQARHSSLIGLIFFAPIMAIQCHQHPARHLSLTIPSDHRAGLPTGHSLLLAIIR